eukprot:5469152-Prorocentrum_lima.AAC.1
MQIVRPKRETYPQPHVPSCLENHKDKWECRGTWLIRHHKRPRRKAYHPNWRSTELSPFEAGSTRP